MLINRSTDLAPSEITNESLYLSRRRFIEVGVVLGVAGAAGAVGAGGAGAAVPRLLADPTTRNAASGGDDDLTPFEDVSSYNNFYEFGTQKGDPARNAHALRPRPWTVAVEGEVHRPQVFDIDAIWKRFPPEERVYRLRCVEAWSMVIPWLGFPLRDLLDVVEPTSHARFVEFTTLHDPGQMPGQRRGILPWPYVEGLRIDEAMHPLTLMALGLYGEPLPNQNGAPIRLIVPWKYGFKSGKSIVRIRLLRTQPATTWNIVAPHEYGFYANVNPSVNHPRWSQKRERRIGEFFKRPTLMFNGYGEQVAHLYTGMDLTKLY